MNSKPCSDPPLPGSDTQAGVLYDNKVVWGSTQNELAESVKLLSTLLCHTCSCQWHHNDIPNVSAVKAIKAMKNGSNL